MRKQMTGFLGKTKRIRRVWQFSSITGVATPASSDTNQKIHKSPYIELKNEIGKLKIITLGKTKIIVVGCDNSNFFRDHPENTLDFLSKYFPKC